MIPIGKHEKGVTPEEWATIVAGEREAARYGKGS